MTSKEEDVARKIANGEVTFTADELDALKTVAEAFLGLKAFGKLASVVQVIAKYVGWMALCYFAIKYAAVEWVKGVKP